MNRLLALTIDKHCPKFNTNITDGSVKQIFELAPSYLDKIFKSSIKSLSPSVDLQYIGYRELTPEEEFNKLVVNTGSKVIYDLSTSNIYAIEFMFKYQGEPISRIVYLPYANRGNIVTMSGTSYHIVPVLSDSVISPSYNQVFIRLLKDKITVFNYTTSFVVNGNKIAGHIIHTTIVKSQNLDSNNRTGRPFTSLAIYLLGKYGLVDTLKRYTNLTDKDQVILTTGDVDNYRDNYRIYESAKVRTRRSLSKAYNPNTIKICIRNDVKVTTLLDNIIFGIIYSIDLIPGQAEEYANIVSSGNTEDDILFWRILLGRISYLNNYSVQRIIEDMTEHFNMLEGYVDDYLKTILARAGIEIDNFYDLLAKVLENYSNWTLNSKEYNSNLDKRYIDVLYYCLYDIIVSFNKVVRNLSKRSLKKKEPLTFKEVNKIVGQISTKLIYQLVKTNSPNLTIQMVKVTSDIMYPKMTALLEDQSRGNGVKRGGNQQLPPDTKTLRGHDLYLGSLLFLTKHAPSPRFRANLYLDYDIYTGKIKIPEDITRIINKLDLMLTGRLENNHAQILTEEDRG